MKFSYKVAQKQKVVVVRCRTRSKRRFLKNLRTINWGNNHFIVYLRVSYGKQIDNFGKLVTFYNDGDFENKEDLWLAFEAFTEKA